MPAAGVVSPVFGEVVYAICHVMGSWWFTVLRKTSSRKGKWPSDSKIISKPAAVATIANHELSK